MATPDELISSRVGATASILNKVGASLFEHLHVMSIFGYKTLQPLTVWKKQWRLCDARYA